ncbi:MAG: MFS transporter [Chloroflexi bacterium]|nr:MFS transporter [Chloroflexota bacterium]
MNTFDRNITKLYWMNALSGSGFHFVVYTLFMLSKGFSMQQFFLLGTAKTLASLVAEVPTGMFSDRVSRKWSLVIASIVAIPSTLFMVTSGSFVAVLIATAFTGVSAAFVSGTDTAMLYDSLKAANKEGEFHQALGRMRWYGSWATALGGIGGGLLASRSLSIPFWVAFGIIFPVLFIGLALKEPPRFAEPASMEPQRVHLKESIKHSLAKPAGFFVLYAALSSPFFGMSYSLWQPYLKLISLPVAYFGLFYAVEPLICGFVSRQSASIEKRIGMSGSLLLIPLLLGLAFLLQSQFVFLFGILFLFLHSVSESHFKPTLETYINLRIPSSRRATVLSFKNMISSLQYAVLAPFLGLTIDVYSLQTALLVLGITVLMVGLVFYVVFRMQAKTIMQNKEASYEQ